MKSIIITFFLLFFNLMLFSQVNLVYKVGGKITNSDTRKNETGVTVNLLLNGKVIGSAVTSTNGKYDIRAEAPIGANLQVLYVKPGLVSKKIKFTGSGMREEDIPAGSDFPLPTLDMDLFSERPNTDFSFLNNEPVASFFWDANRMILDYDKEASAKVRKKIEDLLAQQEKAAAENEAKYQAAINSGQILYAQKKYDEALLKYKEAAELKPQETLPKTKIAELDQLILAQKAQAQANQKLETEYKNLIAAADNLRDQKKYDDAISKYKEALSKKDEAYPKNEISKLTKLIADQKAEASKQAEFESLKQQGLTLMGTKKLNEAKVKFQAANAIKQDAFITQKIKEIDAEIEKEKQNQVKKEQYDLAIKTADNLFNISKFEDAKVKYQEAISIDGTQSYPKQKLIDVAAELAKLQKEKDFKAKIDKLISEGNSAMNDKNLNLAKTKFEEALKLESLNEVAKQKLAIINQQLNAQKNEAEKEQMFNQLKKEGFDLANTKKYTEAKIKLEQALTIKNDAQVSQKIVEINKLIYEQSKKEGLDNQYNKSIQDAKAYEADKNYENALAKYKVASSLKPSESLPKQKIDELEKLISSQEKSALNDKNYALHIGNGNRYLAQQNFDIAIAEYEKALSFKPNDSFAQSKIKESNQLKDNIAKAANADAEMKKQFDAIIEEADKLYRQKKYLDAKSQYENALKLIPTDLRVQNQIKECVRLEQAESNKEADASYKKLLSVADKKLAIKDYSKAKEYYERALTIRSNDPYPKMKLDEIKRLLNPEPVVEMKQLEPIESEKLQPLGVVYERSEKDAIDDLHKAEIERKRLKEKGLEKGADEVIALNEEKENQKKEEAKSANQQVVNLKSSIDDENQNRKEEFQEVVEENKKVRRQQENYNEQANSYEFTDRINIQSKTDIMKLENDIETSEKLAQYEGKTDEMKNYQTKHLNNSEITFNEDHLEKIESIDEIKKVGDQIEQAQIQNNDEKIEAYQKIIQNTKNNIIQVEDANAKKKDDVLAAKKEIVDADRNQEKITIKDVSNAADLNVDLELLKDNVELSSSSSYNHDQNQGRENTNQVVELNKKIASEQKGNEETLRNSTEKLKSNKKGLYDNSNSTYNNEKFKYLSNQRNIGRKYNKIEEDVTFSNYKNVESGSALKDKANELINNNTQQSFDQEQKLIDAQQTLNQTSQISGSQDKVFQPNTLGQEYPEGVSQETFTQNDENGLMKAIITRRIVVIEGHGDVYVRTQTSSATTYSKNGEPSSERVWQKETQGPHLQKNY